MTTVPPGWYDDGHGGTRWWDGNRWTEHVAPPAAAEPVPPDAGSSPYWGGEPVADQPDPVVSVPPGETPKSRPWIVWVVFGVIALGLVLAFAFGSELVPPKGDAAPGEVIEEPAAEEPAAEEPAPVLDLTVDEQAAVDAVERYNEAWLTGDCDAYFATTTSPFRADVGLTDCELFAEASRQFADSVDDYETTIGSVVTQGEMISVATTEAYSSTYVDDSGDDTGVPVDYEDGYEYQLVHYVAGGWAINAVL